MVYAYVKNGIVLEVERRTEQHPDDPYPIKRFYHPALLPYFIVVPDDFKNQVRRGWVYTHEAGFHEPEAFEINHETGELYLPASVPAESFWGVYQDNLALSNNLITAQQDITDRELAAIELGQQVTDLELMVLGGGANV